MEEQYINQGKAEAAAIVVREDEQEDAIDLMGHSQILCKVH